MLKKITFIILFISVLFARQNNYDLSVGTIRYYDECLSFYSNCVAAYQFIATEEIIADTLIDSKNYAKVLWKSRKTYWEDVTNKTMISYLRTENGFLYKYTSDGDSLLQDFNFSVGDSIHQFYQGTDLLVNPPNKIYYDTLVTFPDETTHRIFWGDDTLHAYQQLPSIDKFLDTVLVVTDDNWLLPTGSTSKYFTNIPFYFIDSFGVVYSEWNYRNVPLVGIKTSDGRQYGSEFEIQTNLEEYKENLCSFHLSQNYPNPFNPTTMISYQLLMTSNVKLSVYNMLGQKVATLVNEKKNEGYHQVIWDASDFSSGVYFYKIEAGDFVEYRKCLLVK